MKALILAGGRGTRLEPLTISVPKPIVPFANQPFLTGQIRLLKAAGIEEIILSLNYQSRAIKKVLGDGSALGVRLNYLVEPFPMGTAGAYKFAENFLESSTIVLNGDILTDINLRAVVERHKKFNSTATVVLTKVEDPSNYGLVKTGEDNKILGFLEKPKIADPKLSNTNTVNAGIYVLKPEVLNHIPEAENYSFEYNLFPDLIFQRENVRAFVADDYWLDIGTPQNYLRAHHDLLAGRIKNFQIDSNSRLEKSAEAEIDGASLVAGGCIIKSAARVVNSVLGEGVTIENGARIKNSVIWSGTKIGSEADISDSIIGGDSRIGKNVLLPKGSVLGGNTVLNNFPAIDSKKF